MKDRHDEPVTKGDLAELRRGWQEDLAHLREDLQREFKAGLGNLRDEIDHKIESAKEELMRYNDILDENLRRDVFGFRDEEVARLVISRDNHETRIRRLENSADLVAA